MAERRGRIPLSSREVDNGSAIIGSNLRLRDEHVASVQHTEKHSKDRKTRQDHCRRLKEFINWIQKNYPEYYNAGVVELSAAQKADEEFYYKSSHDLIYTGLNVDIFKSFCQ